MFAVYDSGKPADCLHHKVDASWSNSTFETLSAAQEYARNWCGNYWPGFDLIPGKPIDYSGHGDYIEIREII